VSAAFFGASGERQTVVSGTLGAPFVFTIMLLLNAVLLGIGIGMMSALITGNREAAHDYNTRLMLLSNDMRDIESVLISRGYAKPADFTKPSEVGEHP
jgi:hypothetical protein